MFDFGLRCLLLSRLLTLQNVTNLRNLVHNGLWVFAAFELDIMKKLGQNYSVCNNAMINCSFRKDKAFSLCKLKKTFIW